MKRIENEKEFEKKTTTCVCVSHRISLSIFTRVGLGAQFDIRNGVYFSIGASNGRKYRKDSLKWTRNEKSVCREKIYNLNLSLRNVRAVWIDGQYFNPIRKRLPLYYVHTLYI